MAEDPDLGPTALQVGELLAGRYRLERWLGQGGAAEVFAAYDELAQRQVALKRLHAYAAEPARERLAAHFRHEFLVLSQVAHPNVIAAYDFGIADDVPYYTMELVAGVPLSECGPLSADAVVTLMRNLCEPLAIVHSRRWVHRDLSPRNVLGNAHNQFKLIDFGATVSMNEHHQPVGTPPCMAPEVLDQQALDATADVFGLGALAYFALTGRHAYPARTLAVLPTVWAQPPRRPRDLVARVPPQLDELIMAMLSIDRGARPRSMAEVLHRLAGGSRASLPPNIETARAYLNTPKLTGRDAQLAQLLTALRAAEMSRGAVCVVRGEAGSGRSRMLDTAGLEARLAGRIVARVGAQHSEREPLALARTLGVAVRRALASDDPALRSTPAWLGSETPLGDDAAHARASAQQAWVEWLKSCCQRTPLTLLVDDFEAADADSQRCIAQLALQARKLRFALFVSSRVDAPSGGALSILLEHGTVLSLPPLTELQVEDWVRSVFGDVSNVARLAHWLWPVSGGRPAACMELARYLVEHGIVTLSGGSWRLPDHFDGLRLPTNMREALEARLSRLDAAASEFLQLLATDVQPLPLPLSAYVNAFLNADGVAGNALSQLTAAGALSATANGYVLGDAAARDWARQQLDPVRARQLHHELARWHQTRASEADPAPRIYASYHLWRAGDLDAADRLLDANTLSRATTGSSAHFSRSDLGIALYEGVLRHRREIGRSPGQIQPLLQTLLAIAQSTRPELMIYADACVKQLIHDIGFDLWDALPEQLSEQEHVIQCLQRADERYAQTPERKRGLPVLDAMRRFATTAAIVNAIFAVRYEPAPVIPLQQIMQRIRFLSPALAIVSDMIDSTQLSLGLGADTRELQARIIDTTSRPIPQIDDPVREAIHTGYCYYHALQLATEGNDVALRFMPVLEASPLYAAHSLQVRRVHALMTGRYREAQRFRRERELLAIQTESSDHHLHMSLLRELSVAFDCADVLEVARGASTIKRKSERFPGWKPWATLSAVYLHMLASEYEPARRLLDEGIASMAPFSHGGHNVFVMVKAEVQLQLGAYGEAIELAQGLLDAARARQIVLEHEYRLQTVLAVAKVAQGDAAHGCAQLQSALESVERALGCQSLIYGKLHESGCRIALLLGDVERFQRHFDTMYELYSPHTGLRAVAEQMRRAGRDQFEAQPDLERDDDSRPSLDWHTRIATAIGTQSAQEQAEYLLSLLLEQAEAEHGQLYRINAAGRPVLLAARPNPADPKLLLLAARACATHDDDPVITQTADEAGPSTLDSAGRRHQLLWLADSDEPETARGLLVIAAEATQLSEITPGLRRAVTQHMRQLR